MPLYVFFCMFSLQTTYPNVFAAKLTTSSPKHPRRTFAVAKRDEEQL